MKNGLKIKLHRKYFIALGLLSLLGISTTSQATECFEKFRKMCVEKNGKHSDMQFNCNDSELQLSNKLFDHYDERKVEWTLTDLDNYISDEQRIIKIAKSNGRGYSQEEFSICRYQEQKKYYQTGKRPSSNASSNQSSSSGSSSQSNKKANRQQSNNQSNQSSSNQPQPDPMGEMGNILGGVADNQTSSNSNGLSKMSSNQLIDIATDAENRGDYARAYLAELQLSKNPDTRVSRQGLRQVSFRLRTGQGVELNRAESHRLAIQAANLGDVTAHSYVCADYINGKGVEENHIKAFDYCLFAAEKGDMRAQSNLGWLYENGEGVQRSQILSDKWMCKAAAQGEVAAAGNVKKHNITCK